MKPIETWLRERYGHYDFGVVTLMDAEDYAHFCMLNMPRTQMEASARIAADADRALKMVNLANAAPPGCTCANDPAGIPCPACMDARMGERP